VVPHLHARRLRTLCLRHHSNLLQEGYTAYWSAAPADAFADGTDFFLKSLNIKKSPVQACPTR
jgi:hypothetical protein